MKSIIDDNILTDVANAINKKNGKKITMYPSDFAKEINEMNVIKKENYSKHNYLDVEALQSSTANASETPKIILYTQAVYEDPKGNGNIDFGKINDFSCWSNVDDLSIEKNRSILGCYDLRPSADYSLTAYQYFIYSVGDIVIPQGAQLHFSPYTPFKIINLKNFDTSNITDMPGMFYGCASLISLDLSNFDTSKVTNMAFMFFSCHSLTSLDLSSFDTSKVINMNKMFYDCNHLVLLDISNFDTSNVTNMSSMFYGCNSLTSLDLSNFDTSNVTNMTDMFANCTSLTSLDISNFDTSNATNMSSMFRNCNSLTSLDLFNFNTSNVTNMTDMFKNCTSLKTVYCRNQNDINKFKATSPPANINFILK